MTYPHGSMQGTSNIIILLQPGATAQDLRQPELANSTLHVSNFALSRGRGLDPLGRLPANTADHVGMCECLGCPLLSFGVEGRGDGLGDSRVQRRRPAGDDQVGVALVAGGRAGIAITRPGTSEGGVCGQRGGHVRVCDQRSVSELGGVGRALLELAVGSSRQADGPIVQDELNQ